MPAGCSGLRKQECSEKAGCVWVVGSGCRVDPATKKKKAVPETKKTTPQLDLLRSYCKHILQYLDKRANYYKGQWRWISLFMENYKDDIPKSVHDNLSPKLRTAVYKAMNEAYIASISNKKRDKIPMPALDGFTSPDATVDHVIASFRYTLARRFSTI